MSDLPSAFYSAEKSWLDTPSQNEKECLICHICGEPIEEGMEEEDGNGHDLCHACYEASMEKESEEEE